MIGYRRDSEEAFSVLSESRRLRKISPSLVSLILQKKRKITLERVEEISKLLKLSAPEKFYFKDWIEQATPRASAATPLGASETTSRGASAVMSGVSGSPAGPSRVDLRPVRKRKEVGSHLLRDWINVYVKDCFEIPEVQANRNLIYEILSALGNRKRIDRAISFLLKEGYLRTTLDGRTLVDTPLATATSEIPNRLIRQFHKNTLDIAKKALELFSTDQRYANALILPLDEKNYTELTELIQEFAEKIQKFAEAPKPTGSRLYQFVLNLSPTGGKLK